MTDAGQSAFLRFARRLPYKTPVFWKSQCIAVVCALAGALLRFLVEPLAHGGIPVVLSYPFVIVASVWGGMLAGITTTILAALIADYFWFPPSGFSLTPSTALTLIAFAIACAVAILTTGMFRALVEVHVKGEERATLLAHEMKHRTNNLFGIVQSISSQTARNAATVAEHQALFSARLMALAKAQQLATEDPDLAPDLRNFISFVLEPFGTDRFEIDGPAVVVPQYLGSSFALLFYELGTNSTKYGALSVPEGKVEIYWKPDRDMMRLEWRESGGPPVLAPTRTGFGSRLLQTAFPPEYGKAALMFDSDGVKCTVDFALL